MARTALAVQTVLPTGLEPSLAAADAANGHEAPSGGKLFLHVVNGDASPTTITVLTPGSFAGLAVADRAVVVPAGEERFIDVSDGLYRQADGKVYVDVSNDTSVTIGVFRI